MSRATDSDICVYTSSRKCQKFSVYLNAAGVVVVKILMIIPFSLASKVIVLIVSDWLLLDQIVNVFYNMI